MDFNAALELLDSYVNDASVSVYLPFTESNINAKPLTNAELDDIKKTYLKGEPKTLTSMLDVILQDKCKEYNIAHSTEIDRIMLFAQIKNASDNLSMFSDCKKCRSENNIVVSSAAIISYSKAEYNKILSEGINILRLDFFGNPMTIILSAPNISDVELYDKYKNNKKSRIPAKRDKDTYDLFADLVERKFLFVNKIFISDDEVVLPSLEAKLQLISKLFANDSLNIGIQKYIKHLNAALEITFDCHTCDFKNNNILSLGDLFD